MRQTRIHLCGLLLGVLALLTTERQTHAQTTPPDPFGWRTINPESTEFDASGIFTLHFRFKEPRVMTIDVPGRGRRHVYYMLYEIINYTGEPQTLIPQFTLMTSEDFVVHRDEILPYAQKEISKVEDRTGRLDFLNSVQISEYPILPTPRESAPRVVRGVAIWTDVYDRSPEMNRFSIFVGGLSDGVYQGEDDVIRRKTLQLDFKRIGDAQPHKSDQIEFVENNDPWIYVATKVDLTAGTGAGGDQ